jgi:putative chitinase
MSILKNLLELIRKLFKHNENPGDTPSNSSEGGGVEINGDNTDLIPESLQEPTPVEQPTEIVTEAPTEPIIKVDNMMKVTMTQLDGITKNPGLKDKDVVLATLNEVIEKYVIDTKQRLSHFLAQLCHESGNLKVLSENLNYSAERLLQVFPKYFNKSNVNQYARKHEKIANRVYCNRMGNGTELSGDGWKYRGRGYIQLTGKDNYRLFGKLINVDLLTNPDLAAQPKYAMLIAGAYWNYKKLNQYADADDITTITKKINGGTNGLSDRTKQYNRIKGILA